MFPLPAIELISFTSAEEGDDEAAQRWMQKALEEKLEWDSEEIRCSCESRALLIVY